MRELSPEASARIHTDACNVLGIIHPIVQAGMARANTNAELVAAVSAAGGLGTLGCLGRPAGEVASEIRRIRQYTDRPFAVNFVLHRLDQETFRACLDTRVPVFTFFRGEPSDLATAVARAHDAGAITMYQATTIDEADSALAAGADLLIAQGCEAGGHMGYIALAALLPAIVSRAGDCPVLAAGGIVDGRGLAAALCLGASGAVMGTRFLATPEAPIIPAYKQAIVAAEPGATVASEIFDMIRGEAWPGARARALANSLTARWAGREDELRPMVAEVLTGLQRAEAAGDVDAMILLAGEGAGLISEPRPAGAIVREVVAQAARILREWGARIEA